MQRESRVLPSKFPFYGGGPRTNPAGSGQGRGGARRVLAVDLPGPVSAPTNDLAACRAGSVLWNHASSRVPGDSIWPSGSLAHPHFLPFPPLSFPGPLIGPGPACFRAVSLWPWAQHDPKEHPAQETAPSGVDTGRASLAGAWNRSPVCCPGSLGDPCLSG